ncbi:LysR family transcriptional regulator [Marinobacterium arenosum]|uniref:LysR family transcriptional regulator n=1 Tax=Marinobacterium arenosum TaxID=2862496 RepID=UPI001C946A5E|nr:LysR family transcriptional regulator [Marinobacterium arenosum]MBY4677330.1 LysR family transcriptional regulator [Marinobacterium arenosum]
MDFSLEQLQAFRAAAQSGSFSAAARQLGKAQSVVSCAVSNLEIALNIELFDRSGRYPQLTPAGQRLLAEAELILERCSHMLGLARQLSEGLEEKITLAIDDLSDEQQISRVLSRFEQQFPTVQLELLLPMMEDVSRMVLQGRVDIGLVWQQQTQPETLAFRMAEPVSLVAVAAPDHPLVQAGPIDWEDLKAHRQLLATPRSASTERDRFRIAADVWWVESHWVMLSMACHKLGWALLPRHIAAEGLADGRLNELQLSFGRNTLEVGVILVWHKQKPIGPATRWLLDHLSQPAR